MCTTVSGTTQRQSRNAVPALFSLLPPRMHPKMVSIGTLFNRRESRVPAVQIRYFNRGGVVCGCSSLSRSNWISQTYNSSQTLFWDLAMLYSIHVLFKVSVWSWTKLFTVGMRRGTQKSRVRVHFITAWSCGKPLERHAETPSTALCNEIIQETEPWEKTRLRVQELCWCETKQAAARHLWEEFPARSRVHWSILPPGWWIKHCFHVYTRMAVCCGYLCIMSVWKQCYDFE